MNTFQDKVEVKLKMQARRAGETDSVVCLEKKRANAIATVDDGSCDMQHTPDTQVMYRSCRCDNYLSCRCHNLTFRCNAPQDIRDIEQTVQYHNKILAAAKENQPKSSKCPSNHKQISSRRGPSPKRRRSLNHGLSTLIVNPTPSQQLCIVTLGRSGLNQDLLNATPS